MHVLRRRVAVSTILQYVAGFAVVHVALRYIESLKPSNLGLISIARNVTGLSREMTYSSPLTLNSPFVSVKLPRDSVEDTPKCKFDIDMDLFFPDKSKLWIQIGTWLNPLSPPADTGIIGFEPELSTVTQLLAKRKDNVLIIPAAVSERAGFAIFGSELNLGQSSSLLVSWPRPFLVVTTLNHDQNPSWTYPL